MEIPDTINSITNDGGNADGLSLKIEERQVRVDSIIDNIRHNVNISDYTALEEGRAYFKRETQSDRSIIKNFLSLYGDTLSRAILQSNISDDVKPTMQKSVLNNIKSIHMSIDAIGDILETLNKHKNILDAKRISFIMLGYALNIIKKIYNG